MNVVSACWGNIGNPASTAWGDQDGVLREETVLVHHTENVALGEDIALFYFSWLEIPYFFRVEGRHIDTLGYEHRFREIGNNFEWPLNSVENLIEDTGAQLDREWLFGSFNRITNSESG